jgi:superfamily II DNA or RNA helicase
VSERRRFNKGERVELFLAAEGHCEECGAELERGWHGDHVVPWSAGGATSVANGRALCPDCNLKRGRRVELRAFQRRLVDAVLDNVARDQRITMAYCAPGAGKTLGSQYAMNELKQHGHISTLAVFSPRRNLCRQYELDWQRDAGLCTAPQMGPIVWSGNETPLVPRDAWGYTSTYAALTAPRSDKKNLHIEWAKKHRGEFGLIGDEAQTLGMEGEIGGGTRAAEVFAEMSSYAAHTLMMTGTPNRSDGHRILFGNYTEPDEKDRIYLQPDVYSSYREGVSEEYLRRFHAEISDGEMDWHWADGDSELLRLSEADEGLLRFVTEPGIWEPLIDDTVDRVRRTQQHHQNYCGLVACATQDHVSEVHRYLKRRHPTVRALVAKSDDGQEAQGNLTAFKQGGYDLLLTVRMAYIGYDHKPISTVCPLTHYRDFGHLLQLNARGMRIWDKHPFDQQSIYIIAPHDPKMQAFLLWLRSESERGMLERKPGPPGPPPPPPRLGWAEGARVTETRALGIDPSGDLQPAQLTQVRALMSRWNLGGVPETGLWGAFQELQGGVAVAPPVAAPVTIESPKAPPKTRKEERKIWGDRCQRGVGRLVHQRLPGIETKDSRFQREAMYLHSKLNEEQVVPNSNHLTLQQWEERYALIQHWLRAGGP